MNRRGTLVKWEKDRAFGFIRCSDISADVFVHLRDFLDRGINPQVGMSLIFEEIHIGGKGPRAVAVRGVGSAAVRAHALATRGHRPASGQRRKSSRSTSSALLGALLIAC